MLRIIQTTVASKKEASQLASYLIENKLAACCQTIGPIISTYRWDNQINEEEEYLLQIKTVSSKVPLAMEAIKNRHSYSCPEIIEITVLSAHPEYLDWAQSAVN